MFVVPLENLWQDWGFRRVGGLINGTEDIDRTRAIALHVIGEGFKAVYSHVEQQDAKEGTLRNTSLYWPWPQENVTHLDLHTPTR